MNAYEVKVITAINLAEMPELVEWKLDEWAVEAYPFAGPFAQQDSRGQ